MLANKRSKITEGLKGLGLKLGTDMQITEEEKKNAEQLIDVADGLNKGYIEILKTTNCKMCGGWGHSIIECYVFKQMEAFASSSPALHMAWGKYKGEQIKEAVAEAS